MTPVDVRDPSVDRGELHALRSPGSRYLVENAALAAR